MPVDVQISRLPRSFPYRGAAGLSLRLNGLTKSGDDSEARARSAEATACLSYSDLSNSLGLEVSQGDRPGRVSAVVPLPFGGQVTVTTSVTAVSGNRVVLRGFKVTGGALPDAGGQSLDKVFAQPIRRRNLPSGLRLRSLTSAADGLSARISGGSVTFRPDSAARDGIARSGTAGRTA
ncbi:LmeA family phospholipid-binding protein [Streptomyces sp. NPDC048385]|uniref:LmeA family phospholipid-binding protein n=1 Tax=unclassified Streptomyces TaxID=2593676 RepID=UPI00341EAC7C